MQVDVVPPALGRLQPNSGVSITRRRVRSCLPRSGGENHGIDPDVAAMSLVTRKEAVLQIMSPMTMGGGRPEAETASEVQDTHGRLAFGRID